jgi:hypothetical protein
MSRKRIMLTAAVAAVALAGMAYGVAVDRAPSSSATPAVLACPHAGTADGCVMSHSGLREAAMPAAHDCGACGPADAAAMGCPYARRAAAEGSCPYAAGAERGHCTRPVEPAFQRNETTRPQAKRHVLVAAR